jgi:hypothetical protein
MGSRGRRRSVLVAAAVAAALAAVGGADVAAAAPARIAFRAQGPAVAGIQTFQIFTMRSDGRDLRRVTQGSHDLAPSWSPRHSRLVFGVLGRHVNSLDVVNANGSHRHSILQAGPGLNPDWSSRNRIAFVRPYKGRSAIFTIRPNGKGLRRLTAAGAFDSPSWSPNAKRIAFVKGNDIWVMRANGRHKRRLIEDGKLPNWAPNGDHIAFQRGINVYVALANGQNVHRLTGGDRAGLNPSWSPGSGLIAFGGNGGGIYRMDKEGEGLVRLTSFGLDADW